MLLWLSYLRMLPCNAMAAWEGKSGHVQLLWTTTYEENDALRLSCVILKGFCGQRILEKKDAFKKSLAKASAS